MHYSHYDIEDFASDPAFRQWVLTPNPDLIFFWETWLADHSHKRTVIEAARMLVVTCHFMETDFSAVERENLLLKIEQKIREAAPSDEGLPKTFKHYETQYFQTDRRAGITTRKWQVKVAAVMIGILALSGIVIPLTQEKTSAPGRRVQHFEKNNAPGTYSLLLPDGSVAILNAHSTLLYPAEFDGNIREVRLSGEAFFEIVKNPEKPFVVRTSDITTRALGTSFNVSAYPQSTGTTVCLVSGKVEVESHETRSTPVMLAPGEAAQYDKSSGKIVKRAFSYLEEVAWKDGTLSFKNTPLREVFDQLELRYGVKIHCKEIPKKAKSISGGFTGVPLNQVLESIGFAVNFDFEIKGQDVYVKFK